MPPDMECYSGKGHPQEGTRDTMGEVNRVYADTAAISHKPLTGARAGQGKWPDRPKKKWCTRSDSNARPSDS